MTSAGFLYYLRKPGGLEKIYNMEWLMKNELFQPETFYYEDWGYDIALVLQTRKIVLIPEIGVFYRFNPNKALPSNMMVAVYKDFRKTIEFGLSELRKRGIFDKYSLAIEKYILHDLNLRELEAEKAQNTDALEILSHIREDILEKSLGIRIPTCFKDIFAWGVFRCDGLCKVLLYLRKIWSILLFPALSPLSHQGKILQFLIKIFSESSKLNRIFPEHFTVP